MGLIGIIFIKLPFKHLQILEHDLFEVFVQFKMIICIYDNFTGLFAATNFMNRDLRFLKFILAVLLLIFIIILITLVILLILSDCK